MKKIFSSICVLIAVFAFTACNSTGEVPTNPTTDDNSLAKTVASLVDMTVDEATTAIENAGFKASNDKNSSKSFVKVIDDNEVTLSIEIKDGKVVNANATGKVQKADDLKKFTTNSCNYFYGVGTDLFAGAIITSETTEDNMEIYAEGDEVDSTIKEALAALEAMYKAGMIGNEDYEEAKKVLNTKFKSHSDFISNINAVSTSESTWNVQALYAKFDEDKKKGHSYMLQAYYENENAIYFSVNVAYGTVDYFDRLGLVPMPNSLP